MITNTLSFPFEVKIPMIKIHGYFISFITWNMKWLRDSRRCDIFKIMALRGVTFGHVYFNINLQSFPKKGLHDCKF